MRICLAQPKRMETEIAESSMKIIPHISVVSVGVGVFLASGEGTRQIQLFPILSIPSSYLLSLPHRAL